MTDGIAEMIEKISKVEDYEDRKAALMKAATNQAFMEIIDHAWNPLIKWALPEGTPPYRPAQKGEDLQGILQGKTRMFSYFEKERYPHLRPYKREDIFIQLLESCDPDDAKLLIRIKDKKHVLSVGNKKFNKELVKNTWPDATSDW